VARFRRLLLACSVALVVVASSQAARAQALTKLPMPQSFRPFELRVQWETNANPPGTLNALDWGSASPTQNSVAAQQTIALAADRFVHRAVATGLAPATAYVYRVRSGAVSSPAFPVRTAPAGSAAFRMAWIADNQDQTGMPFQSVLTSLLPFAPDVIGHAGDTVQNGPVLAEWQEQYFDPFAAASNLGQRTPVLVARGNHDGGGLNALTYHWLPGSERWYAETIGDVRFVFLDSNLVSAAQDDFLRAELASPASQAAAFRVVAFHHPPYTNLWQDPGYNGHTYPRNVWVPLFEEHGVDLVINGHTHAYVRGARNGVHYAVIGGAGGGLDTIPSAAPWPFMVVARAVHHFAILDVAPGTLRWTVYDPTGAVVDHVALPMGAPGIPVFPFTGER
jgi:predicted phosphodiesterase